MGQRCWKKEISELSSSQYFFVYWNRRWSCSTYWAQVGTSRLFSIVLWTHCNFLVYFFKNMNFRHVYWVGARNPLHKLCGPLQDRSGKLLKDSQEAKLSLEERGHDPNIVRLQFHRLEFYQPKTESLFYLIVWISVGSLKRVMSNKFKWIWWISWSTIMFRWMLVMKIFVQVKRRNGWFSWGPIQKKQQNALHLLLQIILPSITLTLSLFSCCFFLFFGDIFFLLN